MGTYHEKDKWGKDQVQKHLRKDENNSSSQGGMKQKKAEGNGRTNKKKEGTDQSNQKSEWVNEQDSYSFSKSKGQTKRNNKSKRTFDEAWQLNADNTYSINWR